VDLLQVLAGALTGVVVGMTGVGGGALMTPLLLLVFGTAPMTAVGTDLWFAALTKLAVSWRQHRASLIDWPVVRTLWMGSLPASLLTVWGMALRAPDPVTVNLIRGAVGIAVMLTAVSLLWSRRAPDTAESGAPQPLSARARTLTMAAGAALGVMVTLTSVGAGALGAVVLSRLHATRLSPLRLVATDIAHAIPLALCAGIGHLAFSTVDLSLLGSLLLGSVPAAMLGAALARHVPQPLLRRLLGGMLLVVGALLLQSLR
jgi:hypothetical protein